MELAFLLDTIETDDIPGDTQIVVMEINRPDAFESAQLELGSDDDRVHTYTLFPVIALLLDGEDGEVNFFALNDTGVPLEGCLAQRGAFEVMAPGAPCTINNLAAFIEQNAPEPSQEIRAAALTAFEIGETDPGFDADDQGGYFLHECRAVEAVGYSAGHHHLVLIVRGSADRPVSDLFESPEDLFPRPSLPDSG